MEGELGIGGVEGIIGEGGGEGGGGGGGGGGACGSLCQIVFVSISNYREKERHIIKKTELLYLGSRPSM